MKLPSGAREPAADIRDAVAEATTACRRVTSISTEVGASGSVGGQRLRGRLLAGLAAPSSARLEAVAPFGQPVFIFVARGSDATLLLPRDNRVLEHGRPAEVLEAIAGVPLDAAELRSVLLGCAMAPDSDSGRRVGDEWRVVSDGPNDVYLRRESRSGPWHIVATVRRDAGGAQWRAEYRDYQNGLPRSVRLVAPDSKRFDLRLALSQVETNVPLGPEVFRVEIPPAAVPIALPELKQAGPLRGK